MMDAIKIYQDFESNINDVQRVLLDSEKVLIRITKTGAEVEVFHNSPLKDLETLTYQIGVVE